MFFPRTDNYKSLSVRFFMEFQIQSYISYSWSKVNNKVESHFDIHYDEDLSNLSDFKSEQFKLRSFADTLKNTSFVWSSDSTRWLKGFRYYFGKTVFHLVWLFFIVVHVTLTLAFVIMMLLSTYKVAKKIKKLFDYNIDISMIAKAVKVVPVLQSDAQFPKEVF